MRREDRAMDMEFGLGIIDKSRFGLVSMVDEDGEVYGLPLSIVRDGNFLYFHSSKEGKKVRALEKNPGVSIVFVGDVHVPENYTYEELEEMNDDPSMAVKFISSVFTTEFESAIVKGHASLVEEREEKIKAMRIICEKYAPTKMKYFDTAINAGLARTNVYRVEIEDISSKRKKYDDKGVEMKWGRI